MSFTGKLGTESSVFGNYVFGIVDGLGIGPLGFNVHVLAANEIRVVFTVGVTDTALDVSSYSLSSIALPGTAVTPTVSSVRFFDESRRSVVLSTSVNMTSGTDYSLELNGVSDGQGDLLVGVAKNFRANVVDPPRAVGAWQSKRGFIDVLFDRSVGPFSAFASFDMRDSASSGPGIPASQTPWGAEDIPEDTVRIAISPGIPSASGYSVDYAGVLDESINAGSGFIPVTLSIRSSPPYSLADLLQFQIVDAFVLGGDFEFLKFGIVRVFYNGPAAVDQPAPETQFSLFQHGPHPESDVVHSVSSPDATNLATLKALCASLKAQFNAHLSFYGVHFRNDPANAIISPAPTDLQECIDLLNEGQGRILSHFSNTVSHVYRDYVDEFGNVVIGAGDMPTAISVANVLKAKFNVHVREEQSVQFVTVEPSVMEKVSDHSSEPSSAYPVRSAYTYFTDLHVTMSSSRASVRIEALLTSQDAMSLASPADFTGNFTARAQSSPAVVHSHLVTPDGDIEVALTGEVLLPSRPVVAALGGRPLDTVTASMESSLPAAAANINFLAVALNRHRVNLASGSGHEQDDPFNVIYVGVSSPALQDVIDKANELKLRLNGHVRNQQATFHIHADSRTVEAPDATDIQSLARLVADIRDAYVRHNQEGPHLHPGFRIYNAGLFDTIRVRTGTMADGASYVLRGSSRSSALQLPGNGELGFLYVSGPEQVLRYVGEALLADVPLELPLTGLAVRPSLASAVPKPGIALLDDGALRFESDAVEVYFSKPMALVPLGPFNLSISGGSLVQKETDWVDARTASIRVVSMDAIPYSVVATGLTDEAGNPVL